MSISLSVLIVEDSEDDALLLVNELKRNGFDPQFERVDTAKAMKAALARQQWGVVIADHNMPRFSSDKALSLLKKSGVDLPFIIVSGTTGENLAVEAMRAGAHDYIMKDNLKRLIPAIRRELREAEARRLHKQAEKTIHYMAYHDALTGLDNRREFEHRMKQALKGAKGRGLSHAVLYVDLDQFKIINDTCGHIAGDELLRQLAVVLQDCIRENDTLARLGGDEFGILLESCPLDNAEKIAEDLRQAIKDFHFVWQDKPFRIGVSIGLSPITSVSTNVETILSEADIACYAAKDLGRNRIHTYSNNDIELTRRHGEMQWVSRIHKALDENRFLLYRQAILPLGRHNKYKQYNEILIRLRDSDANIILPGAFIPAAERYNLMPVIDRWVIQTLLSYLAKTGRGNDCLWPGMFSINLSGASISDDSLCTFINEQLWENSLPPQMFCFEITETAAIANLNNAVRFITRLKDDGCSFSLDDFGCGLSSFSYLKNLPVDYLKIDGGFIRNMLDKPIDYAIVEAINRIGHVTGLETIAEFVESEAIKQAVQSIGIDYAQGYGIERPRPLEE